MNDATGYTATPEGTIVTATNGRRYKVVGAEQAGPNVRRVFPHIVEDLYLQLDSKRAKAMYLASRDTAGNVKIIASA